MQSESFDNSQCIKDVGSDQSLLSLLHIIYVGVENLLCVLFQFFQIYFGFNALFHEQSFQLIAIAVFDLGWSLYGIGQALTIKYFRDRIEAIPSCQGFPQYDLTFRYFDIPYSVVYFAFALLSIFISFKLYQQFGWNLYKKIGADVKIKVIKSSSKSTSLDEEETNISSPKKWAIDDE
ncbi:14702_t:CDS:2 [Cetraspora pellucida]|uniref:14702_t:CDS:1 n=1 Tax=Cetraspora pellucida TaxID=1433469 RepID=A0ACA9KHE3_9GLOM|nr:14702_t:CDS:2 [Cetraspora pellucida]